MSDMLSRMRALMAKDQEQQTSNSNDNAVFPHWDVPVGSKCVLRLIPDGESSNPFFWRDRCVRKLPFNGIKGMADSKKVNVIVPAWNGGTKDFSPNFHDAEEYIVTKEQDPIQNAIADWWNQGEEMQKQYRTYKRAWTHILQGFVRDPGGVEEKNAPSTPIRRFLFAQSIFKKIPALLANPDLDDSPTDFENGLDMYITVSKNGQYNEFTVDWARKVSALNEIELQALNDHELPVLKTFLPKPPPDAEYVNAIHEMFEASVAGLPYDPNQWSKFYKPVGVNLSSDNKTTVQNKTADVEDEAEEAPAPAPASPKVDLMAKLKTTQAAAVPAVESEAPKAATVKTSAAAELMAKLKARQELKQ